MKHFSDCSGPCETCQIHYIGGCLAGHGDDDYCQASKDWIRGFLQGQLDMLLAYDTNTRCNWPAGHTMATAFYEGWDVNKHIERISKKLQGLG